MTKKILGALAALLLAGCSTESTAAEGGGNDEVADIAGEPALPTAAAAEAIRVSVEASRNDDGEFMESVFCSPKDESRAIAAIAASAIGAPDPFEVIEQTAGAGEGQIDGNVFSACSWEQYDDPIAGIESYGVSSGPITGSIEDYVVDIFSLEGERPTLEVVTLEGEHGGGVTWSCDVPSDDLSPLCELDWTDGTFVVSLYFIGEGVADLDLDGLRDAFVGEIPGFVDAAANVE